MEETLLNREGGVKGRTMKGGIQLVRGISLVRRMENLEGGTDVNKSISGNLQQRSQETN